jgi:hypothetical protein
MPADQVAGVGLLGVAFGALIGWALARRIDEQRARRDAYARYLSAVDEVASRLTKRWRGLRRDSVPLEPWPDHEPARLAFTALLILASKQMVEVAADLQDAGNKLGFLASSESIAKGKRDADWQPLADRYAASRRRFIGRARKEVGAGSLPARLFVD